MILSGSVRSESLWGWFWSQRLWENSLPSRAFQMCNFLNMYAWKTASKEQPIQNYWCTTTTGRTFWTVMKHILTFRFFKTLCVVFHIVSVAYKNFLIVSPVYKTNQSGQSSLSVYKLLGKCNFQVHLQKNKINYFFFFFNDCKMWSNIYKKNWMFHCSGNKLV